MIKEIELHHPMSLSLIAKDSSVMLPKTKQQETLKTLSLMLKDLSEENSMILPSKKTSDYGHSK
jgi:hypothetical protein